MNVELTAYARIVEFLKHTGWTQVTDVKDKRKIDMSYMVNVREAYAEVQLYSKRLNDSLNLINKDNYNGDITITYSFAIPDKADTEMERYDRIQISLRTLPFIKKFKTDAKENDAAMKEAYDSFLQDFFRYSDISPSSQSYSYGFSDRLSKSDREALQSADLPTSFAAYECLWDHVIDHINRRINESETICTKLNAFREKHWKRWKIETAGLINLATADDALAGKNSDE
jgi:hypothetical protein